MKYDRLTDKNAKLCQVRDMPHEQYYYRLQELENKIEQGKLVELPCKVGDICYFVYTQDQKQPIEIIATEITTKFIDNEFAVFVFENGYGGRAIGNKKVVFTNKADAKARLKELQNDK